MRGGGSGEAEQLTNYHLGVTNTYAVAFSFSS